MLQTQPACVQTLAQVVSLPCRVILNNGPQPVDGTPLVLVYNYAFEVAISSALAVASA